MGGYNSLKAGTCHSSLSVVLTVCGWYCCCLRDVVSGLVFREGTHELFSASFDRTVKIWSLDDGAYVDSLFGHQAEVYAVDALRQERVVTSGNDHTCRVWKIPEESQLIFRLDPARAKQQWLSEHLPELSMLAAVCKLKRIYLPLLADMCSS